MSFLFNLAILAINFTKKAIICLKILIKTFPIVKIYSKNPKIAPIKIKNLTIPHENSIQYTKIVKQKKTVKIKSSKNTAIK